ncbi:MAG: hypothetical protein ACJAXR_003083 [Halopseudomonas sp.]
MDAGIRTTGQDKSRTVTHKKPATLAASSFQVLAPNQVSGVVDALLDLLLGLALQTLSLAFGLLKIALSFKILVIDCFANALFAFAYNFVDLAF